MNKILQGDCLDKMKELEDNYIDTIITDPPYGLSFMGKKWDYDVPKVEIWKECLRVLKPGGTALIFAGSRTQHRMAVNVEDAGFILKDTIMWLYGSGFPKATDISKQLDKGIKRNVVGKAASQPAKSGHHAGLTYHNVKKTEERFVPDITEPATEEAKLWNGWKSHGLKPAYEPILVAVKPNDGTYANNALKHGVSGLNIDGGRIDYQNEKDKESARWGNDDNAGKTLYEGGFTPQGKNIIANTTGRFPANVILDEEAGKMLDEQTGELKSGAMNSIAKGNQYNTYGKMYEREVKNQASKGGASRFFYCAKASKSERNAGCEKIEAKQTTDGRKKDADNAYQRGKTVRSNFHPTVKPIKLMEYLCTLTKTPTGGIVLDPFAGSGTTGVACKNTGRDFILIEMTPEYIPIIEARTGVKRENNNYLFESNDKTIQRIKNDTDTSYDDVEIDEDKCSCGGRIVKTASGRCCEDCLKDF